MDDKEIANIKQFPEIYEYEENTEILIVNSKTENNNNKSKYY